MIEMSEEAVPNTPGQLLLKPRDAAAALAISPRTLWALTNRGEIDVVRCGRMVRYAPSDLRAWINSQKGRAVR